MDVMKCMQMFLLDSGSDRSYVTSSLVKKINPVFVQSDHVSYAVFGEGNREIVLSNVYSINMHGAEQGQCNIHAVEVPIIIMFTRESSIHSVFKID